MGQYLGGLLQKFFILTPPGQQPWFQVHRLSLFMRTVAANFAASTVIIELGIAIGSIAGGILDAADEVAAEQRTE